VGTSRNIIISALMINIIIIIRKLMIDHFLMIITKTMDKSLGINLHHNHKKMVDHFLMIMIMLIIRALTIMFLDVPTKTYAT